MPVNPLINTVAPGALLTFSAHAAEEESPPDAELLEFIGSFLTEDGQWLDPLELDVATLPSDRENEENQ